MALDWVLATYVTFVALVAVAWSVPWWPYILAGHTAIVVGLLLLPPRGAAWPARMYGHHGTDHTTATSATKVT